MSVKLASITKQLEKANGNSSGSESNSSKSNTPEKGSRQDTHAAWNQDTLNEALDEAISFYDDEFLPKLLQRGAQVNELTYPDFLNGKGRKPLEAAVIVDNLFAARELIKSGADVNGLGADGSPIFQDAVGSGYEEMVREFIKAGADVDTYYGSSALDYAMFSAASLPVIDNSEWNGGDEALKEQLLDWFHQRNKFAVQSEQDSIPFPLTNGQTLKASYPGNLRVVALLMSKRANPTVPNDNNQSIIELVENPAKFVARLANRQRALNRTILKTADLSVTFEMNLLNRTKESKMKIIVEFDLRQMQQKLGFYLKQYAGSIEQARQQSGWANKFEQQIQDKFDEQNPNEKIIKELEKDPNLEAYFDNISRQMAIMLNVYHIASVDFFQKDKSTIEYQTKTSIASQMLSFIGMHAPSPFGVAFSILGYIGYETDKYLQTERFKKIANAAPNDRTLQAFSRDITCHMTVWMKQRLNGNLDKISREAMIELAKRSYVVAMYTIYHVDKLDINVLLPARERADVFSKKICEAVRNSEHLSSLIEQTLKSAHKPITYAYNNAGRAQQSAQRIDEDEVTPNEVTPNEVTLKRDKCICM